MKAGALGPWSLCLAGGVLACRGGSEAQDGSTGPQAVASQPSNQTLDSSTGTPAVSGASPANVRKVGGQYANGFVSSSFSYIDGKRLTFGLTEKNANDQSVWMTRDKNPRTPVRDAVAAARQKLGELFPEPRRWTLKDVKLDPVDFTLDASDGIELWHYAITFERHREPPNPHSRDVDGEVTMIVLLDGTAIHPSIEAKK